jgi:hypothetical protein
MEGTFLVRLTLLLLLTVRWLTAWLLLLPLAAAAAASARSGAVPLEAPAGSLICFDSRCWHMSGSFPAAPGSLRQEDEEDSVAADGWCAAAFPSCARSVLAEIYLCHACSCHEINIEGGNAPGQVRRRRRARLPRRPRHPAAPAGAAARGRPRPHPAAPQRELHGGDLGPVS